MKTLAVTTLLLGFAVAAHADDTPNRSLFFTPDEVRTVKTLEAGDKATHAELAEIHLGAVMYYAPESWTVWLQGQKVASGDAPRDDLKIVEVTPDHVRLEITPAPDAPKRVISLKPYKPYQSYRPSSDAVVEGSSVASADSAAR